MGTRRTYLTMAAIALAASSLTAAAPAIAHGVEHALFAHNADRVDGLNAVGSGAGRKVWANKLVATDDEGRLPDNIIEGVAFARGKGTQIVAARRVLPTGNPDAVLLRVPGLGSLEASCPFESFQANVSWTNTTSHMIDVWRDIGGPVGWTTKSPDQSEPVVALNLASGDHDGTGIELGRGDGTSSGRTASVVVRAARSSSVGPCTFQASATVWSAS